MLKVKKIKLSNGKVTLVDSDDYKSLSKFKWNNTGYYAGRAGPRRPGKARRTFLMHRVVMGAGRKDEIDHINRDPLDNRKSNLRFVSHRDNIRNSKLYSTNKSGHRGISWDNRTESWFVVIVQNGKNKFLGRYGDIEVAKSVYKKVAREVYGEFAQV